MTVMGDGSPLAHSPTLTATTPRDDASRFAAGAQVGEYVIERFIGAGAMGEVYGGRHPVIGKRVAIKVLRNDLAASAEAAERFIREARAVNQIEHENVVDVFAFGRLEDGRLYLVMDLVDGRSLRAALVDGPLDIDTALAILDTIANALDAAHARGVVHRDLKPDNIVLSNATPPKVFVLDFGIAKLISTANAGERTGPGTLTGQGTWLGTPGYMAPEQWSVDGAGPASDRYALGVIAFELLAGALPFSAPSVPGMMEQHFRADVPALSARGAIGLPTSLDTVLRKALAKDPDARYPTARAFVDALRAAAGTGAHRARGAAAAPGTARKLWLPAIAGAGVLAIAIVVVVMSRDDGHRTTPAPVVSPVDEPGGSIAINVQSTPPGAEVKTGGRVRGVTPLELRGMRDESIEIAFAKPGYLGTTVPWTVKPGANLVQVRLTAVSAFEGVWKLRDGQLRKFARNDDRVDVFKRTEVAGEDTFFKSYAFVAVEAGVAFAADDEIIDARAPNDPGCHVKVHVEYRYDPKADVLEQRRDKVKLSFHDGSCTLQSREMEPTILARADAIDAIEHDAPVGIPPEAVEKPTKKSVPVQKNVAPPAKNKTIDPKAAKLDKQRQIEEQKKLAAQRKVAPSKTSKPVQEPLTKLDQANVGSKDNEFGQLPPPPQQAVTKGTQQAPQQAPQQQILPQPQPAAPPVNADDTQLQQRQKK